ncbi:hypothetical protein [Aquimarina sp. Aq107]|uniref:hypothetical protein n=1 Tax=Aquimarina sp. Aq107 TaxID=1191912 RepID=UPI000D55F48C|nr:hypothetical protein [Aquimarina sp. Aq107]
MKRTFLIVLVAVFTFYSCEKEESIDNILETDVNQKGYQLPNGDYIGAGYGWNPSGNSGDGRLYGSPFDRNLIVKSNNLPSGVGNGIEGNYAYIETIEEFYEYTRRVRGLDTAFVKSRFFGLNVDRDADILDATRLNEKFISAIVTIDAVSAKYDVIGNPDFDQLTEEAKSVSGFPERFKERYGNYYVNSEVIGGSISLVYTWNESELSEQEKSTVKTGFGLSILSIFGIGGSSTVEKTEMQDLVNKSTEVNVVSTARGYAPQFGRGELDNYNEELNKFVEFLKSNPVDNVILYQQVSNYSQYIQTGAYNEDPLIARKCIDLNNQWTYVYNAMDLVDKNTPEADDNKGVIRSLRDEALNNMMAARECINSSLPPNVDNSRYLAYFDFYEINKRLKIMYRFYDTVGRTYFYTHSQSEIASLQQQQGRYRQEGWAYSLLDSPIPNKQTVPLYRFERKEGTKVTYFYTTNKHEGDTYFGGYQGVAGYVYTSNSDGAIPLHRYRGTDTYLYTLDHPEDVNGEGYSAVNNYGYRYEGIQCYVFKS